jgi:rRNA maturation RNase YbeY
LVKSVQKYNKLKDEILGSKYELSVAVVSPAKSREFNMKFRGKDRPTNVLAFPLSKNSGEILLCKEVIKREAKNFDRTAEEFFNFLVIHGMLHLKGMRHGAIMDKAEKRYDTKYFNRHRRGLYDHKSRGGRIPKRRKKS